MLLHIPEVLSKQDVREMRRLLDAADWTDGLATVGEQGAKVKQNRQLPVEHPAAQEIGAHIRGVLARHPLFISAALPLRTLAPLFNRYEGGDTYGTHEVKLPAGDLIVYASTSLHRVTPVTRGARICSFFWTQSLVRQDWQRAMLFELDQTIQKLRARLGDDAETTALTGHYHNLLRLWAET